MIWLAATHHNLAHKQHTWMACKAPASQVKLAFETFGCGQQGPFTTKHDECPLAN